MKRFQPTLILAALLAAVPMAQAQSQVDVLRRSLQEQMPPFIGQDNSELAAKLLAIKPTGAISKNFKPFEVMSKLVPRSRPASAADCTTLQTAQKEADTSPCVIEVGNRNDPTGAYAQLSFSKNIGAGKIKFLRRAAFKPGDTEKLTPVKLTDEDAYKKALDFMSLVGAPTNEIPKPPSNARNPFPVRHLAVGAGNEKGDPAFTTVIQKSVFFPRAFEVPGLYKDPTTGQSIDHVLAPGGALVSLDDTGIQAVNMVWGDPHIDTQLDPRLAKSANALLDEMAEDLYNEGVREVGTLSILIGFRQGYPNPDDPNPVLCPVCGVLRPSLRVTVTSAGRNPIEAQTGEEAKAVTAGLVREYDLIATKAEEAVR